MRCNGKTLGGKRCKRQAAQGRKRCAAHGAKKKAKPRARLKPLFVFKVKLVAPDEDVSEKRLKRLQGYVDKIARSAGYSHNVAWPGLTSGYYMFHFEGPEKKIRRSHSKLKKIRSKAVHVYAVRRAKP